MVWSDGRQHNDKNRYEAAANQKCPSHWGAKRLPLARASPWSAPAPKTCTAPPPARSETGEALELQTNMCRSFLLGACGERPPFSSSGAADPLAPAATLKNSAWLKLEPRGVGLRDDCSE